MTRKYLFLPILIFILVLSACGGGGGEASSSAEAQPTPTEQLGDPEAGEPLFQQSCSACHGPDAKGLPGLGKDMTTSTFIGSQSDEELLEFVKTGRPVGHPDNTTGVDMPPKGGNPALTDEQLLDIIAYIRSLRE